MNAEAMMNGNESANPWEWPLPAREARRITAAEAPRWLVVKSGGVWITRSRDDFDGVADVWLAPGQALLLPAGTEWIAEGRPEARVVLLLQAPARRAGSYLRRTAEWLRGLREGFAARAASAVASARRAQGCISAGDSIASAGTVQ